MFNINDVIEIGIQLEVNAEETYRKASRNTSRSDLAELFTDLAEDEARHGRWFLQLRERIEKTGSVDDDLERMGRALLKDVLQDQTFSLQDTDFTKVSNLKRIFAVALEFEKDTVLFYQLIGSFIHDTEVLGELNKIIDEEKKHIQALEDRREVLLGKSSAGI